LDPNHLVCMPRHCRFAVTVWVAISNPVCCCPTGAPGPLTAEGSNGGAWGGHTPTPTTPFGGSGLLRITGTGTDICAPSGPFGSSVAAFVHCNGAFAAAATYWTQCGKCL
jgi:hypothetical protein